MSDSLPTSTDAFSVSDGNTVIDSVQAIVPVIVSALNGLVAKKASISSKSMFLRRKLEEFLH